MGLIEHLPRPVTRAGFAILNGFHANYCLAGYNRACLIRNAFNIGYVVM